MTLKTYSPYVKGIVGADFKLTVWQKIRILFSKKISVIFIEKRLKKRKDGADNDTT